MLYRSLPDLPPPSEADLDTAAMAASEASIERAERHLRILARLTDIAMNLAEGLGRKAEAHIEATATPSDAAPKSGDDPNIAFGKMAQTVRRTIALEARLAAGVKAGRDSLIAERAARRATLGEAHQAAKTDTILDGLHDAYAASSPEAEYEERVDTLMEDAREHLLDADDLRDWLDRPVGETVARLCAALGLDPDACAVEDDAWRIRRPPTEFERHLRPSLPSLHGEGGFEHSEKTGGEWRSCNDPP
jgi:hypothetical protein